ncbi:MAG: hypothetical protein KJO56_06325 [Gammaproteobacteria bacterium]|nr:hypothetical protein [Gammaproteobacteria bacterium]
MTITLGEALAASDGKDLDVDNSLVTDGYDAAKKELPKARKRLDYDALGDSLKKALMTALDIALDDILGQAWSGWHDMRVYADPKQTPPDDVNIVPIASHRIESEYEPEVDVLVEGVKVHTFPFYVAATLDVQGGDLVVQRGAIQEIRLATLKLGGIVKLRDRTLLSKDVAEIAVPGVMRLARPIPILSGTPAERLSA